MTTAKERLNPLLVAAAAIYFAAALLLLFGPDELLAAAGSVPNPLGSVLLQLVAAALLGFAMLNWMQRFTVTGGIYGRPLVIANLAHAMTAALSLAHFAQRGARAMPILVALTTYGALALAFGWAFFRPLPAR